MFCYFILNERLVQYIFEFATDIYHRNSISYFSCMVHVTGLKTVYRIDITYTGTSYQPFTLNPHPASLPIRIENMWINICFSNIKIYLILLSLAFCANILYFKLKLIITLDPLPSIPYPRHTFVWIKHQGQKSKSVVLLF